MRARERKRDGTRDGYAALERDGNKRELRGFAIETKARSAFGAREREDGG